MKHKYIKTRQKKIERLRIGEKGTNKININKLKSFVFEMTRLEII